MLKFRSLTNVRPTKDLGSQVICAPTEGQFKVTPEAAKAIGVTAGDYLQIVVDDETNTPYIVKGEEGVGGKLAASNKTGAGILTLSAAAAWDEMKGDANFNTHYDVAEEGMEFEDRTYYALEFKEAVEKQARKKSEDKEVEVPKTVEAPQGDANFEEM